MPIWNSLGYCKIQDGALYHKALHLGCCSSPWSVCVNIIFVISQLICLCFWKVLASCSFFYWEICNSKLFSWSIFIRNKCKKFISCLRRKTILFINKAVSDLAIKRDDLRDFVPLYNLKNMLNTLGVLLWVNFTKSNTPPWVFVTFFILHKWYQTAQPIINVNFWVDIFSLFRWLNSFSWLYEHRGTLS